MVRYKKYVSQIILKTIMDKKEVFFDTVKNELRKEISVALSNGRKDSLKKLVARYNEQYGRLESDETFYRFDKEVNEWYECAPLFNWCCDLETRDLFLQLCEK